MGNLQVRETVMHSGIVAILRAQSSDQLLEAAEAVLAGGVRSIEVTMTTPAALEVLRAAKQRFDSRVLFGAGSVLDPETARAAILAGADFIVCPTLNLHTILTCNRYSVPVIPGAYTPTEILTAWESGASAVKIFPASAGGPAYIKAVKAPLPQVVMAAVGGVDLSNAADFIRAGASILGIGGELVNQKLLDQRDFSEIQARAQKFCEEVEKGRA